MEQINKKQGIKKNFFLSHSKENIENEAEEKKKGKKIYEFSLKMPKYFLPLSVQLLTQALTNFDREFMEYAYYSHLKKTYHQSTLMS